MNVTETLIDQWQRDADHHDANDVLASYRGYFHIPRYSGGDVAYFCGNSLGLQPISAKERLVQELEDWKELAVDGHFKARNPWFSYHRWFAEPLSIIVGAKPHEVVAMNTLTVNLHLMMTTFYRTTAQRFKVILCGNEFPSDRYAIESQVRLRGFEPTEAMVEVQPLPGADSITTEQVVAAIDAHRDSVALVLFSGVHFFSGQRFNISEITRAAHDAGAKAGFDLAHAIGNVELSLHEWDVDFAVWCSYKYLNSGPGATGGLFVHERYADRADLHRLAGWWGNNEATRFAMEQSFEPTYGADGWQLSNAQVLQLAVHRSALEIFMDAGIDRIYAKRDELTAFAERLITDVIGQRTWLRIITPADRSERGAQLSIRFDDHGKSIFDGLLLQGVVVDWRSPNVMRMAPAPLYTSFDDVVRFGVALGKLVEEYS